MKRLLLAAALLAPLPALAQNTTALVVASCGAPTFAVGRPGPITVDTTGKLCTSGGGGTLTVPTVITGAISGSSNQGAIGYGTLTYTDTNNFGAFQTSVNSYAQFILQNSNAGTTASADFVVSNNLGTATTYYGNFGMNSSGFTGTGSLNLANAVYMTSTSSELVFGSTTANGIHFVVNGGATDAFGINTAGAHCR